MTLSDMTVLVTGGTGFIGGRVARRLAAEGAAVRVLTHSPEKVKALAGDNIEIVQGNLRDAARMHEICDRCTHVFHAAASFGRRASQQATNVDGTRNLMLAAAKAGVERLVYVSTIAVYGYGYTGDVTEDMPHHPGSVVYNIAKSQAETVVREVGKERGLPFAIIRPGMVYGPGSNAWTTVMFKLAKRNPTLFIGSGKGSTFPIHVDDVADLGITLLTHPAAAGEAFHCTPDPGPSWREFLGEYAKLAGHSNWLAIPVMPVRVLAPLAEAYMTLRGTPQDIPTGLRLLEATVTYKMTKAKQRLGWQPRISLEAGIQGCAPWLREKGLLG